MKIISKNFLLLLLLSYGALINTAFADVVKPALVEISVEKQGVIRVELRASIEALLTGINARYKNTQESPNAEQYDNYRKMSSAELLQSYKPFEERLLASVYVMAGEQKVKLTVDKVEIPPTGYTKVPRISIINLRGELPSSAESLRWYYPEAFGDNAVRVRQVDRDNDLWHWSQWQWIRDDMVSEPFSLTEIVAKKSLIEVVTTYIAIGFDHIVPKGLDHILFVLGLFLFSKRMRPLLLQVTMFTLAHTITLGLAMNNVVQLPANVVEPLIALSIAYVGIENILDRQLHLRRLVLVFLFGLLHGLGFAGVLSDFGMPEGEFAEALISFNIGVEFGQLAVISVAYLLLSSWFKDRDKYRKVVVIPGSVMISVIGLYWFLERLELF